MTRRRSAEPLTAQERDDWAEFATKVQPLPGRVAPAPPIRAPEVAPRPPPPRAIAPQPAPPAAPPLAVGTAPGGLDSATWNRFRGGKLVPARTLDLHGRTAQQAFFALRAFVAAAHADRVRCVEVITGRGAAGGGRLRRELPLWLNLPDLRPLVLAASHPHAANEGAVRLLLRKPR
ncbi:MAG: Smr/MutS family protein [Alphaproteobacteria bacterium]|nr:Smr/MutS family protein [Alphaproteobacteria bacterium]